MNIFKKVKDWYHRNFYIVSESDDDDNNKNNDNYDHKVEELGSINDNDKIIKQDDNIIIEPKEFNFPSEKSYIFDKLDEIFMDQREFTSQIDKQYFDQPFNCYNFDKKEYDLYYDLNCAIEELVEAIRELNTKKWKRERKTIHKERILEEIVDATKFLNQAILRLGYNANDFYELHRKKSNINRERQKNGY